MTADKNKPPADHPSPEELTGYFDRELDPVVMIRLRGHIESCPACAAHLSQLSRIDDLGAALNEDLPGPEYWTGLKERILKRVDEEGGASEAGDLPGSRPVIEESPWRQTRPRRRTGLRPLAWTVATAAALGFVVLSTRGLLHQPSPVEPDLAARSREHEMREAPSGSREAQSQSRVEKALPEAGRVPAERRNDRDVSAVPGDRRATDEGEGSKTPGALAEVAPAAEPNAAGSTADETTPREEDFAKDAPAGTASPAPAAVPPAPVVGSEADQALISSRGAVRAPASLAADGSGVNAPADSDGEDPGQYLAEVDARLAKTRDVTRGNASELSRDSKPESRAAGPVSRADSDRGPANDFRIVHAAALRALDAGEFDLAARGFDIVSRQDPESDLARDADYQGRMARIRARLAAGEDRRGILKEAADRADLSFRKATDSPGPAACREALADERVRLTLLEEIEPAIDRGPFEERVRFLSRCS